MYGTPAVFIPHGCMWSFLLACQCLGMELLTLNYDKSSEVGCWVMPLDNSSGKCKLVGA